MILRTETKDKIIYMFDEEDIGRDCWCYEKLYNTLGIINDLKKYKDFASVENIKSNSKTNKWLKNKIKDNYSLVNLKSDYKTVSKYRVKRKKLTRIDEVALGMDYLNYSPTTDDTLSDMVIVYEINK